jgi:peptide/nickel transport system ATP-binding protein
LANGTAELLVVSDFSLAIAGEEKLSQLSFTLQAGERVALIGASGCGKSLTAGALLGVLPPEATWRGSLRLDGCEVAGLHPARREAAQRVAAIFQDSASALNPLVTVGKQLMRVLATQPGDAAARAVSLLREVDFDNPAAILSRYPMQLSGGQRQRVCIALALACRHRLVVADEPTTALDLTTQHHVAAALTRLTAAPAPPALLFITHDIALAAQLCRRALVMAQGRIVEQGTFDQLTRAPQHPYTRELVNAARRAGETVAPRHPATSPVRAL